MEAIKKVFPNSRFFETTEIAGKSEWKNTHDWVPVDHLENYTAWVDFGYGCIALTYKDTLLGVSKYCVIGAEEHLGVVCLDKDYYGTEVYIFKR